MKALNLPQVFRCWKSIRFRKTWNRVPFERRKQSSMEGVSCSLWYQLNYCQSQHISSFSRSILPALLTTNLIFKDFKMLLATPSLPCLSYYLPPSFGWLTGWGRSEIKSRNQHRIKLYSIRRSERYGPSWLFSVWHSWFAAFGTLLTHLIKKHLMEWWLICFW